jgi:hypothetical protein
MKKILFLCVSALLLSGCLLASILLQSSPTRITKVAPVTPESPTPLPQKTFSSDSDYYQYFLNSNGLVVIEPRYENLTGKGKQAIFIAIGEGCGSCHYNEIHIFDGRKEIFTFYGEDTQLTPILGKGFTLIQPLLKEGQSYSERNEYEKATYMWNGNSFERVEVSPNWIDTEQAPG